MSGKDYKLPEDYDPEIDDGLQPLRDLLGKLPDRCTLMINPKRYKEALASMSAIRKIIIEDDEDASFVVKFDDLLGTALSLIVTVNYDTTIYDVLAFQQAIGCVDNIGISSKLNEILELTFTYQDVRTPIPPAKK